MPRFYITTAISYPNGDPHIGHAYEAIAADVIARAKRLRDHNVRFLTGTDEHGLKMVQTARALGVPVQSLATERAASFRQMDDILAVAYDRFIRTTDADHRDTAQKLWSRMAEAGDLYLDKYTGWYSVRDEAYFDEKEIVDGLTPTGNPVEWIEEESWFFRLSDYRDRLKAHFAANPDFLQPESSRNEILVMLDDLRDISISRTTFDWGVPVPGSPGHVMYVWVDALANYLTGATVDLGDHWWPADLHIIGKDIAKFHAIYWPAFLMSAKLDLPKAIFCHGHLLHNGEKMSKSKGNVVDPMTVVADVPPDALRYYLMSDITFGKDGDFVDARLRERFNSDLANGFGNLISRTCALIIKYHNGVFPQCEPPRAVDDELIATVTQLCSIEVMAAYDRLDISGAIREWMRAVNLCNLFITQHEPWSKTIADDERAHVLSTLVRAIATLTVAISPVIPDATARIQNYLRSSERALDGDDSWYRWRAVDQFHELRPDAAETLTGRSALITKPEAFFPRLV